MGFLPLSFAQERLWVLDRLLPASCVYNVAKAMELRGALDKEALARALKDLVRRHETLRTRITVQSETPTQQILADDHVALELQDVNAAQAMRCAEQEALAPFDLEGPLLRARLFRLGPQQHWLLLTLHHIVTDGWSMGVLWRELSVLYEARCRGVEAALAPLPVQYADYALWQREWLQGAVLERQLGYWKRALAELPALELPTDRRRPLQPSYRGSRVRFELAPELTQALKALGRAEGATLFMTLLAAFQVLLYRYSGQEDLAVGIPVAGRNRPELEGLIGFFVNTLVLRGDLSGAPSFREYLGRVREGALEAYAHQDLPFEKLVEELAPRRDLSRNPLFQVMFVLQNTPREPWQLPGLQVEPLALETHSAKFDLSMELTESDGRLLGVLEYATDLFEAASAERMVGHWRVLLESIVADPGERISHLDLLGEAERRRLLLEWNDTARPYPREACIHALFEAQVERAPGAIAVSCGGQQLTYGELNARANRLAHELRARGVGPDALVALCLERSLELVVALLGILKAGGAYVPLDPSYPAERLAFMLQDTRAPVLITEERLLKALPAFAGHTLCLDRDAARLAQHPASNPEPGAHAHHLAYVIYTSGSTGKPKGVMIEHRSLVNHMLWMQRRFPLSADDRVLQKTPTSADASVWEFFAPLISGARLVLAAPQAERSPPELAAILEREQISVAQFVPSLLASLLQNPGLRNCESLRRVYCGGEMLPREAARRFASQCAAELVNLYGPTEATIDATFHVAGPDDGVGTVPIGQPIDNLVAYVADDAMQPVPVGVPGELLLGGVGLARGFLGRPELTAEHFIAVPFAHGGLQRVYRTGDLVRRLADGRLEYLGRKDSQLKIRGFRIEPGEIESTLREHPGVADAVAAAHADPAGDGRLVAYFVRSEKSACTASELRAFLKSRLPGHMVPAFLLELDAFPRTPNGKVDRKRLPAPGHLHHVSAHVAPRNELEAEMASLWESVLGIKGIGVQDNFFDLGGHSLLAMTLLQRVRDAFQLDLTPRMLFDHATVAELVECMQQVQVRSPRASAPAWTSEAREAGSL